MPAHHDRRKNWGVVFIAAVARACRRVRALLGFRKQFQVPLGNVSPVKGRHDRLRRRPSRQRPVAIDDHLPDRLGQSLRRLRRHPQPGRAGLYEVGKARQLRGDDRPSGGKALHHHDAECLPGPRRNDRAKAVLQQPQLLPAVFGRRNGPAGQTSRAARACNAGLPVPVPPRPGPDRIGHESKPIASSVTSIPFSGRPGQEEQIRISSGRVPCRAPCTHGRGRRPGSRAAPRARPVRHPRRWESARSARERRGQVQFARNSPEGASHKLDLAPCLPSAQVAQTARPCNC